MLALLCLDVAGSGPYHGDMRGARITIRCDCGEVGYADYGRTWPCGRCRRRWNTNQIPADEYWGIMRETRRFRFVAISVAVGCFVPAAVLLPFLGLRAAMLVPLLMAFWFMFYMPRWRRQVRRHARSLQRWKLRPE
jgi:hypothetical protein